MFFHNRSSPLLVFRPVSERSCISKCPFSNSASRSPPGSACLSIFDAVSVDPCMSIRTTGAHMHSNGLCLVRQMSSAPLRAMPIQTAPSERSSKASGRASHSPLDVPAHARSCVNNWMVIRTSGAYMHSGMAFAQIVSRALAGRARDLLFWFCRGVRLHPPSCRLEVWFMGLCCGRVTWCTAWTSLDGGQKAHAHRCWAKASALVDPETSTCVRGVVSCGAKCMHGVPDMRLSRFIRNYVLQEGEAIRKNWFLVI